MLTVFAQNSWHHNKRGQEVLLALDLELRCVMTREHDYTAQIALLLALL
jgi:hypothetical protein